MKFLILATVIAIAPLSASADYSCSIPDDFKSQDAESATLSLGWWSTTLVLVTNGKSFSLKCNKKAEDANDYLLTYYSCSLEGKEVAVVFNSAANTCMLW